MESNDTVFETPVLSATSSLYISKIGTDVFSQCAHVALFLDIFPEPEHSPLLFVADWYRFNLFFDFDTSRSDLYININGT